MLAADKDQIYAHVRHQALELRKTELDQLVQRYCSLIGISSIASGFAFSGLVEFEVDEAVLEARAADQRIVGFHHMFYYCGAISLILGIYVTAISTVLISCGYRLALQGGTRHALDRAVAVLRGSFPTVVLAGSAALLSLQLATVALLWIKTYGWGSDTQIGTSVLIAAGSSATVVHGVRLMCQLRLRIEVDGDLAIQVPTADGGNVTIELEDVLAPDQPTMPPTPTRKFVSREEVARTAAMVAMGGAGNRYTEGASPGSSSAGDTAQATAAQLKQSKRDGQAGQCVVS